MAAPRTPAAGFSSRFTKDSTLSELQAVLEELDCFRCVPLLQVADFVITLALAVFLYVQSSRPDITWFAASVYFALGAFFWMRIGGQMHDGAHGNAFDSDVLNRVWARATAGLLGESPSGWRYTHGRHHAMPNVRGLDDDQAERWNPLLKFHSHVVAFVRVFVLSQRGRIILPKSAILLALRDFVYCFKKARTNFNGELVSALVGIAIQCYFFCVVFGGWAIASVLVNIHFILTLTYLNLIFATNHYDLESFDEAEGRALPFVDRQIRTSRDVTCWHPFFENLLCFGLECQIEHHLFPTICRWKLHRARPVVRAFALAKGLPYHEATFWTSVVQAVSFHVISGKPMSMH